MTYALLVAATAATNVATSPQFNWRRPKVLFVLVFGLVIGNQIFRGIPGQNRVVVQETAEGSLTELLVLFGVEYEVMPQSICLLREEVSPGFKDR